MTSINQQKQNHVPVLTQEVLTYLQPQKGESYLDNTAGYGGHAEAILKATKSPQKTTLVDRDAEAVKTLEKRFGVKGVQIIHQDFLGAAQQLLAQGRGYDLILADLGTSSPHLDRPERGFAFSLSGPLDMRMDVRQKLAASEIVNRWNEADLVKILRESGQEPRARAIAHQIVTNRPIETTEQLAKIVTQAAGWRLRSRVHPATRTFQALRITVNDELEQLRLSLPIWTQLLNPEGRLAVISFHSLEDRIVKDYFKQNAANTYDAELRLLTKKPVTGNKNEIVSNPRARSAKLRAVAKIKNRKDQS